MYKNNSGFIAKMKVSKYKKGLCSTEKLVCKNPLLFLYETVSKNNQQRMNIAIILGVSEYEDKQNNLPGCKKDAEIVNSIISKTSKFESILYINEKKSSALVKEKITDFISENKTNEIEELFFYFTGHGEFYNEEFYYILSDFNKNKRKQTSLQNEEVDSLIKTLNPNLVVKIIDACQSGKTYIKETSVVAKYFKETQNKFNNCYFLNSSLKDQSSMQSDLISDFTLSFIKSVKEHKSNEIRYKDIIDYISDEFENNELQTPFFVIQADYTEKFCEINDSLKEYLLKIDTVTLDTENIDGSKDFSLIDKIKKQASEYLTKEQALEVIDFTKSEIEKIEISESLNDIYDLEVILSENYDYIINKNTIGNWLDNNTHDYFAKSITRRVRKDRNHYSNFLRTPNLFGVENEDDYEYIKSGFDIEIDVPFKSIIFNLNSKYPNVESFTARAIYLVSQKQIRYFYFVTNFITKNWDERKLNSEIEWFFTEHPIYNKEEVVDGIKKVYKNLEKKATIYLEEKFNNQEGKKE
ncbi:caspase domain-containing protein [Tenacibaculum gallaicum]|uniref:Caspase domain-containing protein n=1 Tax=Tenacibaculum gallaicum TaxID=561505 RepID=A0A3E0HR45_9FLAO|nr:caspase family protein [Tenacibaculum gallaicum]REH48889.1 caspase domain-containing protein [Tenacibaculum gallaicum]